MKRRMSTWVCWSATVVAGSGADWPCWRGPLANGTSPETDWFVHGQPDPRWHQQVGLGYSSVTVSDGRLYTAGHDGSASVDAIQCLDAATGQRRWQHRFPAQRWNLQHEGGTNSTPVVNGSRVFSLNREGKVHCLDADSGELRWSRNLCEEIGIQTPKWGFAASPLVIGERVFLNLDRLLALDANSGDLLWETPVFGDTYSTPTEFRWKDSLCLAAVVSQQLILVRQDDGQLLHSFPWTNAMNAHAATPVVCGERLFLSTGYNGGGALVEFTEQGAHAVWANKRMRNKLATSVLWDQHLFGFDESVLKCLDLNGNEQWRKRGLGRGALIAANGTLILLSARGELIFVVASPESYQELGRRQVLGEGVHWTAPVLSDGFLYCRDNKGNLVCLDHRRPGPREAWGETNDLPPDLVSWALERSLDEIPADEIRRLWVEGTTPPSAEAFLGIARGQGLPTAAALFRAVRGHDPDYCPFAFKAWRDLGWYEISQGRPRQSWFVNKLLVEAYPENAEAYRRLADTHVALHETAVAVKLLQRSLELDPQSAYVKGLLDELRSTDDEDS